MSSHIWKATTAKRMNNDPCWELRNVVQALTVLFSYV